MAQHNREGMVFTMLTMISRGWNGLRAGSRPPGFYEWSFGKRAGASLADARSAEFHFRFLPSILRRTYLFQEEALRALARVNEARGRRKIALCYSGGADSDFLALSLAEQGIPFELYFLNIWGKNRAIFDRYAGPLEQKIGRKVQIVPLDRAYFYEHHSLRLFRELGCELPTCLAMTYLFEQIPRDRFILVGDGDLNRSGTLFTKIAKDHPLPEGSTGLFLPFSYANVFYHLWALKHRRQGEFYFFSSTPELVAAAAQDPRFRQDFPQSDTRAVVLAAKPELENREKSTNWDDGNGARENGWIRAWLAEHARREMPFWRGGVGAMVRIDDIFLP